MVYSWPGLNVVTDGMRMCHRRENRLAGGTDQPVRTGGIG